MENGIDPDAPIKIIAGIALAISALLILRETVRSFGIIGILVIAGLSAMLFWSLEYYEYVSLSDQASLTWIGLAIISMVLGIGASWKSLRRGYRARGSGERPEMRG